MKGQNWFCVIKQQIPASPYPYGPEFDGYWDSQIVRLTIIDQVEVDIANGLNPELANWANASTVINVLKMCPLKGPDTIVETQAQYLARQAAEAAVRPAPEPTTGKPWA